MSNSAHKEAIETGKSIGRSEAREDLVYVLANLSDEEMPFNLMQKIFDAMEEKRIAREGK